jgi:hypothetical protein
MQQLAAVRRTSCNTAQATNISPPPFLQLDTDSQGALFLIMSHIMPRMPRLLVTPCGKPRSHAQPNASIQALTQYCCGCQQWGPNRLLLYRHAAQGCQLQLPLPLQRVHLTALRKSSSHLQQCMSQDSMVK